MAKGGAYERELCKIISLWWSNNEHDDLFWRTSGSGGRATVRGRKGKTTRNHCGDICNTDAIGEPLIKTITFESKRGYSRDTIADLMDCPKNSALQTYEDWFEQAETSRKNSGSYAWLIIARRDRREPLVYMPSYLWTALREAGALKKALPLPLLSLTTNLRSSDGTIKEETIIGIHFNKFLEDTEPKHILQLRNNLQDHQLVKSLS
ncbi:hypothetical protein C4577_04150 [Candidatus Parcubacteria bacterium]|nr:MAG: hypothetical protein C4577_04150 [Candidatus Parcubacteria bacterium]